MSREALVPAPFDELLRRAREGERAALEELFRRYQPRLEAWSTQKPPRAGLGLPRPSDIVQEAALHAYHGFASFRGTTEVEWNAWLHSVFKHRKTQLFRDALRQKRKDPHALPLDSREAMAAPAPGRSPSQATAHDEQWWQILTQIRKLPDAQSEAIYLCYLKELPIAEVAQRLERTEAAVGGLLQRGLKTLRERVEDDIVAEPSAEGTARDTLDDVATALLVYLRRRDAGELVDVDAFAAEHEPCAEELRSMLYWVERLRALAPASTR
jgi:RNA polymerase sigma-70 factor (ECF subfamily)